MGGGIEYSAKPWTAKYLRHGFRLVRWEALLAGNGWAGAGTLCAYQRDPVIIADKGALTGMSSQR
ncbi:MAG: hypothetical protein JXA71_19610 [Chitinispirillaceae bacterium]|nr:hypothetical protein [Chitinispirillaceae bacterium]